MENSIVYRKGTRVRVINEESEYSGLEGLVESYTVGTKRYKINFFNGKNLFIHRNDITKVFTVREEQKHELESLKQMVDLALNPLDKEWLKELSDKINSYDF